MQIFNEQIVFVLHAHFHLNLSSVKSNAYANLNYRKMYFNINVHLMFLYDNFIEK